MQSYGLLIQGKFQPAAGSGVFRTTNPADVRETVAEYAAGDRRDVAAAVSAAAGARKAWAATSPVARGRFLASASQKIEARKKELAELLVREEGKTLAEATGEVGRAADIFRYYGALGYTLGGQTIPHDLPSNIILTQREPLGVVGLITPWNFPIAIPAWKLAPALVCGNTVVLKPASQAPGVALELASILTEAGLPPGVLNVVTGGGRDVGAEFAENPVVRAVSFTGSHAVGKSLYTSLAPRMIRAQMEMGGKNPTVVLADADLDLAVNLVTRAAFGLTGQACTATSRVIVDKSVAGVFLEKLVARAKTWKVGPGLTAGVEMGPAVSEAELLGNLDAVAQAQREGASLAWGGARLTEGDLAHGWFMQPAVLAGVTPQMRLAREEVFGPVLAVIEADGFDHAMDIANGVEYGLSASVVTRDFRRAMQFGERIEAGVVKVNQISTGLALQAPFGGYKSSSTESFREQGLAALEFYSKTKTVYLDYSV
jgi:acyl-CoA reductase-like NAD-dependent aldehyde dehydrogenase